MKKLLLSLLLISSFGYSQTKDSTMYKQLSGKWKCVSHHYMPIYADYPLLKNPSFYIGDTSVIINDTFVSYYLKVDKDVESSDYNLKDNTPNIYRIELGTKVIPKSVINHSPNYTQRTEFILVGNVIYYDYNGVVYKFKKS